MFNVVSLRQHLLLKLGDFIKSLTQSLLPYIRVSQHLGRLRNSKPTSMWEYFRRYVMQ